MNNVKTFVLMAGLMGLFLLAGQLLGGSQGLVMALVFVLGTFGMNFQITTALMATKEFHEGPTGYGMLGSIMAIGSLAGALLAARRKTPRLRILLLALAGFTVSTAIGALAPTYEFFALYSIAAVYYWIVCLVLSFGQTRVETRLNKFVAR